MGVESLSGFLHTLRTKLSARTVGSPDAELLDRFVSRQDEAAFEGLVWRHGSMVLGVCRRVLRNAQDVEDAFQATFLVLARKAASVGRREALAAWLYQTAYRVALRTRARAARHLPYQVLPDTLVAPETGSHSSRELPPVLDEEILRLPLKYRTPLILCYLEGLTTEEAARRLCCPRGTVNSRLAWARQRLRARLTRRGLGLPVVLAAGIVTSDLTAAVPAELAAATLRTAVRMAVGNYPTAGATSSSAIQLMEGVIHTMWAAKMRLLVLVVVTATALAGGASLLARRVLGADPAESQAAAAEQPPQAPPKPPREEANPQQARDNRLQELQKRYAILHDKAAEEVARLQKARDEMEMRELNNRVKCRMTKLDAEEALRLQERELAMDREGFDAEVKLLRQKLDRLRANNGTKPDELNKVELRLNELQRKSLLVEVDQRKHTADNRKRLVMAEEELDLVLEHQKREQEALAARLRAAEKRLEAARTEAEQAEYGHSGVEPDRKLDQLLRELAELRREVREKGH